MKKLGKRIWSMLMAMVLFFLVPTAGTAAAIQIGDVNADGRINTADVATVWSHVRGLKKIPNQYIIYADANKDSNINIGDVSRIYAWVKNNTAPVSQRYIVSLGDDIFAQYQEENEHLSISHKLSKNLDCSTVIGAFSGTRASSKKGHYNEYFCGTAVADAIATGNWTRLETGLRLYSDGDIPYFSNTIQRLKSVDFSKVTDITINYGTIDWKHSSSLYNYKKSMRYMIDRLHSAYPNAKIHVVSAINRFYKDESGAVTVDSTTKQNSNGHTLCDFARAAQDVAKEKNVNFINVLDTVNFTFATRAQYYEKNLTSLNSKGNDVLAKEISNALCHGGKPYLQEAPKTPYKPSFGWIDDDSKGKVSILYEWALENQVPFTCAVISGKIDVDKRWLTSKEMVKMYNSGLVRFASHTKNHIKLSTVDRDTVKAELSTSKTQIEGFGVPCDFMVYPKGAINQSDLDLVSKDYPYGFAAGGPCDDIGMPNGDRVNNQDINFYQIKRVSISGAYTQKNGGLTYLKDQIDDAIATNGMLIFMSHVGSTSDGNGGYLDPQKDLEVYNWALNYIRERGYDIEPVITVCDRFAENGK